MRSLARVPAVGHEIDNSGARALIPYFASLISLTHLNFVSNLIFREGAADLAPCLPTTSLQHLDLSYNVYGIGPEEALHLSFLKTLASLTFLLFEGNMGPEVAAQLVPHLYQVSRLQHIDLSYCDIDVQEAKAVGPQPATVTSLSISTSLTPTSLT